METQTETPRTPPKEWTPPFGMIGWLVYAAIMLTLQFVLGVTLLSTILLTGAGVVGLFTGNLTAVAVAIPSFFIAKKLFPMFDWDREPTGPGTGSWMG